MSTFSDRYYEPPAEAEEPCRICHYMEGDCTCPECPGCGEVGNPACINVHFPWGQFPHFRFELSTKEKKEVQKALDAEANWEAEVAEEADRYLASLIPSDDETLFLDQEPHAPPEEP